MGKSEKYTFLLFVVAVVISVVGQSPVSAQHGQKIRVVYEVQVQFSVFDRDETFWSTFYESTNYNLARNQFMILSWADAYGQLDNFVEEYVENYGSYRWLAQDVRMITRYEVVHTFQATFNSPDHGLYGDSDRNWNQRN